MIEGCAALMALRDDIIGNSLGKALIEHKIYSEKTVLQPFGFYVARIFDDTPLQLVHIRKSFVLQIC